VILGLMFVQIIIEFPDVIGDLLIAANQLIGYWSKINNDWGDFVRNFSHLLL
jgi:hypothetical protein